VSSSGVYRKRKRTTIAPRSYHNAKS